MPILYIAKESDSNETRSCVTPETLRKLVGLGFEIRVESGCGAGIGLTPDQITDTGASLADPASESTAEIVFRINKPTSEEISRLRPGTLHVSLLDPFNNRDLLNEFAAAGVRAVSLEMVPRSTLAQKMDVLSSQANLAGYAAVLEATRLLPSILPMMMTPAGTLSPARVFVIGVGVAGLQAIATAKRLGARVDAFDTRPAVEEQVKSLGAKFVKIDLGDTGQTDQGYAKELTPEQIEKQKAGMAKVCAQSDIVITTAKLFGRPAPRLLDAAMIAGMKPGSVIVDLAAETGGNVEGTVPGETITTANGVHIIGTRRLECTLPASASQVLAANYASFIEHFWNPESAALDLNREEPILAGCLMTADHAIVHPNFQS